VIKPSYDLQQVDIEDTRGIIIKHHPYKSLPIISSYSFVVLESGKIIAAYVWAIAGPFAKSVCAEAPYGVLALSRMVAVPKTQRDLNHVSKPLRRQMKVLIDRGRWPVLVTFSDEGQGHTGHVYKCSGWQRTTRRTSLNYEDKDGCRKSDTAGCTVGEDRKAILASYRLVGESVKQRWEHWICPRGTADKWISSYGWRRVETGRLWRSGNPAHKWVQEPIAAAGGVVDFLRVD